MANAYVTVKYSRVRVDPNRVLYFATGTGGFDMVAKRSADKIVRYAKQEFLRAEVKGNDHRTSETTPPKYLESFVVVKVARGKWRVANNDPGAIWVEFGAHAGGHTPVLKYRPLGRAIWRAAI